MHHFAAIIASLACLGLIGALYYCNVFAGPRSWLRSETVAMILLSLLTALFPVAVAASMVGLWAGFAEGLNLTTLMTSGIDMVSAAAILATALVFRALVKANGRAARGPMNVTPLTPRPRPLPTTPRKVHAKAA